MSQINEISESFSKWLKSKMKHLGISSEELAKATNLSLATIHRATSKKSALPSRKTITKLEVYFGDFFNKNTFLNEENSIATSVITVGNEIRSTKICGGCLEKEILINRGDYCHECKERSEYATAVSLEDKIEYLSGNYSNQTELAVALETTQATISRLHKDYTKARNQLRNNIDKLCKELLFKGSHEEFIAFKSKYQPQTLANILRVELANRLVNCYGYPEPIFDMPYSDGSEFQVRGFIDLAIKDETGEVVLIAEIKPTKNIFGGLQQIRFILNSISRIYKSVPPLAIFVDADREWCFLNVGNDASPPIELSSIPTFKDCKRIKYELKYGTHPNAFLDSLIPKKEAP